MRSIAGLPPVAVTLRRAGGMFFAPQRLTPPLVFSWRQRWDSWHFALQMPRRALHAEPHFSWLTLRYTSKLAHFAITLAWLVMNPICERVWNVLCVTKTCDACFFVTSAVVFVAFCVANATARVAYRTHFSWLTLRYTSKLAHSAITLAWLATNPICGWVECSLRRKDLRRRFFTVGSGGTYT